MAQAGYTPIQLYFSTTAAAVPTSGNLANGELAINITDGKLYFKNNSGTVTLLAGATAGPAGGSNTQVQFNSSGALAGSANMTFNGTTLVVNDLTDSSLTAGRVTYAGTAGNLIDSANLTFNGTTLTANTIGAFTLSGTISGGGNQINNVIIGTTTPLAGAFTTLTSTGNYIQTAAEASVQLTTTGQKSYSLISGGGGNLTNGFFAIRNNTNGNNPFYIDPSAPANCVYISSTGLAVTGAISATGNISVQDNLSVVLGTSGGAVNITHFTPGVPRLAFTAGGSEKMALTDGGLLGINTNSPLSQLDVVRQGNTSGGTIMMSGSKTNAQNKYGNLTGAHYTSSTYPQGICAIGVLSTVDDNFVDIGGNVGEQIAANKIRFWTASNTTTSGGTQRGIFNNSGSLCIGSESAGNAGTINVSVGNPGTTVGGLQLWSTTGGAHYVHFGDNASGTDPYRGYVGYAHATDSMVFGTASSDKMRLDATNGLQVGTNAGNCGANGLHVTGVIQQGAAGLSQQQIVISGGNAIQSQVLGVGYYPLLLQPLGSSVLVSCTSGPSSTVPGISMGPNGPSGVTFTLANTVTGGFANLMVIINGNGQVGSISTSGSSTSFNTSSDYRLKEDIAPMTGALAKVALLKPRTYKWKVDGSDGEGFVAHELAEVSPQCVSGEKDEVDEDGNPKYQGIDTSFLVATLTAAIQEQQAIIESLKARLDAANL